MARAVMPMLSASCGRTRIRAGASPVPAGGLPVWPARRMPWRSLRRTRRAQNQYSSPAQVLASSSRLEAVSLAVPEPLRRTGESVKAISAWRATKSSKVLMPSFSTCSRQPGQVALSASQRRSAQ